MSILLLLLLLCSSCTLSLTNIKTCGEAQEIGKPETRGSVQTDANARVGAIP